MKGQKPLVPIIMVSAIQVPEEALACADCSVEKGSGPAPLLEKIRQILGPIPHPPSRPAEKQATINSSGSDRRRAAPVYSQSVVPQASDPDVGVPH
jgi:hypothetical protein